ncbi:uncharacterized protein HD556DRAFT_1496793 [Suillus plorans]|uniref:Uncharacterized protein n=1 Tax=Suillus plorans TaxID=116603 RepID=A0A9P7AFQ9_9AGAM|nr:uncharacterized protein HD556DRAFT_1496793 [Suillus plorans]KAG1788530.1 hypothetical protein HD556DRAFT_1496793 [Suillus plorans]
MLLTSNSESGLCSRMTQVEEMQSAIVMEALPHPNSAPFTGCPTTAREALLRLKENFPVVPEVLEPRHFALINQICRSPENFDIAALVLVVHFSIHEFVADPAAAKLFNGDHMHSILPIVESLMIDADKFKQAAAADILTGLLRGSNTGPSKRERNSSLGSRRALIKLTKVAVECATKRPKRCLEESNKAWLLRMEQSLSPQPGIRTSAEQAIVKSAVLMKMRASAKTDALEWQSPFARTISINNPPAFLEHLYQPIDEVDGFYVDLLDTGFLAWTKTIKCYPVNSDQLSAMGLGVKTVLTSHA